MKKMASLILALAMCLALGVPAFATSETGNLDTELSSILPTLKMTMPSSATIILNPYRNAVTDAVANAATGIDKGDRMQVMNGVFSIVSTTTSKVHVKATVTGSTGGNAEFSSTPVKEGESGHKVNLTLTYALAEGKTATVPLPDKVTSPTNVKTITDSDQDLEWDLPAATTSGDSATQRLDLQFGGTCSDSPSEDDGPWTDGDTVSASFVFTVTPITDFPMIQQAYQATDNTPTHVDFVINTTKPSDCNSGAKIKEIKTATTGWADVATLAAGTSEWNGSTWDGTKITLKKETFGAVFGVAAQTVFMQITLTYKDKASVDHDITYMVKVNVLKAPQSGA